MWTVVSLLYVKAGKTGREGSETLPEIQAALVSQLCLHFRYRHFALGHVGNIHVMAAGLNQTKKAYGVVTSCLLEVYEQWDPRNECWSATLVGSYQLTTDHFLDF